MNLWEQIAALVKQQEGIIEACKAASRGMTEEETKAFDGLQGQIDGLTALAEREEKAGATRVQLEKTPDRPLYPAVMDTQCEVRDDGGFKNLGEYLYTLRFRPGDDRLKELTTTTTGADTTVMPPRILAEIMELPVEGAIVRPGATKIPAGDPPDGEVIIPALDQTGAGQNQFGGVSVEWIAEGADKPETNLKLKEVTLKPNEVAATMVVTDKLLRNWSAASPLISRQLRAAMADAEDVAFIAGDGTGKPAGFTLSAAAIAVKRQTANAISLADLAAMETAMMVNASAEWIAEISTKPQLITLKDGGGQLIYMPGNVTQGIPDTLFGRPIRWTGKTKPLGTKGDLMLANMASYLIKDGSGPYVAASEHVLFRQNKTVIKCFWNVDGKAWMDAPYTMPSGTKVSPFVMLDVPGA